MEEAMLKDINEIIELAWYNNSREDIKKKAFNFILRVSKTIEEVKKNKVLR